MRLDPIAASVSASLRRLNAISERDGWDRPPSLWAMRRDLSTDEEGVTVQLDIRRIDTGPVFLTPQPAAALSAYARDIAARSMPEEFRGTILAYVFVTEAWMVLGNDESITRAGVEHTIHQRADRIEVRILSAVDSAGIVYSHIYPRDPARSDQRMETAGRPGETGAVLSLDGAVIDALRTLIDAST